MERKINTRPFYPGIKTQQYNEGPILILDMRSPFFYVNNWEWDTLVFILHSLQEG